MIRMVLHSECVVLNESGNWQYRFFHYNLIRLRIETIHSGGKQLFAHAFTAHLSERRMFITGKADLRGVLIEAAVIIPTKWVTLSRLQTKV